MIPKTIKIGGFIYKINIVDGLADNGSSHFATQTILLCKNQTEDRMLSALYHEIIEIWNELGDFNLPHQTIQTLESYMFQTIKDNKLIKL